ncbi:hypothetical protein [Streptomyces sp. NPDC002889]|uniref:hypothetical protein n=1 Tax=Streptomyces sp. NPDC002889 TaxID=3364669 RepID=UPI0036D0BABB
MKRPVGADATTALRTAAVAALVATTGRSVPELHRLDVADVDLEHRPFPQVELDTGPHPLDKETADGPDPGRGAHAAHRTLVTQVFGAPLRPGALRPH